VRSGVLELASTTAVAPRVLEVDLRAVSPPAIDAVPGQYLSVVLPAGERRAYSIASPPGRRDGVLLLVRRRGQGGSFLAGLALGDRVAYEGPRGGFRLEEDHPGDLVFVATGVGIAPIVPMMELAASRPGAGRLILFWGLEDARDAFWPDRLARLASDRRVTITLVLADREGPVTAAVLAALDGLRAPTFYACGHGAMVRDLSDTLDARGVGPDRVHADPA
jgi:CDP-4-dehydro-6-deoxyglucose reductase